MDRLLEWTEYFRLPPACRQEMTITKTSLKTQEAITSTESRLLDGSEVRNLQLFGIVSRNTANIKAFLDDRFHIVEIYFIRVEIEKEALQRLGKGIAKLLHKLIPHPCIILLVDPSQSGCFLSLAPKVLHQNNPQQRVVTEVFYSEEIHAVSDPLFLSHLSFEKADKLDLHQFYNYYLRIFKNLSMSSLSGGYKLREENETEELWRTMEEIKNLESAILTLRRQIYPDLQMKDRVRVNTEIYYLNEKRKNLKLRFHEK